MISLRRAAVVTIAASMTWSASSREAAASAGACPLPLGRQVEAVRAFAKMMPVFRHPRCANCHGDFDILSDQHTGAASARSSGIDPRSLLTAPQRKALHAGCDSCHDNIRGAMTRLDGTQLSGWLVAPQPMLWNGKSDEELCKQIKQFDRTGREFIDHLERDHGEVQFIDAAFVGDRALGAALASFDLRIQPPPGTKAQFVALARKWVEIVGDGYAASPECGCSIELEGDFNSVDITRAREGHLRELKVNARMRWAPEKDDLPSVPTFGDVKSTFFRPVSGEVSVEVQERMPGIPVGSCGGGGRKTFSLDALKPTALRFMTLELAEDGRYRLMLVIPDMPDPFPPWQFGVACTTPGSSWTATQDVRYVAVVLGKQEGVLDSEHGIAGQLAQPIRYGPREVTGNWSFKPRTR